MGDISPLNTDGSLYEALRAMVEKYPELMRWSWARGVIPTANLGRRSIVWPQV